MNFKLILENGPCLSLTVTLKLLELALSCVCVVLVSNLDVLITVISHSNKIVQIFVICTTYGGYLLITAVILLGNALNYPLPLAPYLAFTSMGAVMFTTAAGITLSSWIEAESVYTEAHDTPVHVTLANTSGIIAFITALVFILDSSIMFHRATRERTNSTQILSSRSSTSSVGN